MRVLFFVSVSLLALSAISPSLAQETKGFRLIGVPAREHGYNNFDSRVINSQKQLEEFLMQIEKQPGWNERAAFVKAMRSGKIEFAKESLLLVRQTEGSGSNRVTFAKPEWREDTLVCKINREVPRVGTADLAYYCFAVAVHRSKAKQAEVWVQVKGASPPSKAREVMQIAIR